MLIEGRGKNHPTLSWGKAKLKPKSSNDIQFWQGIKLAF